MKFLLSIAVFFSIIACDDDNPVTEKNNPAEIADSTLSIELKRIYPKKLHYDDTIYVEILNVMDESLIESSYATFPDSIIDSRKEYSVSDSLFTLKFVVPDGAKSGIFQVNLNDSLTFSESIEILGPLEILPIEIANIYPTSLMTSDTITVDLLNVNHKNPVESNSIIYADGIVSNSAAYEKNGNFYSMKFIVPSEAKSGEINLTINDSISYNQEIQILNEKLEPISISEYQVYAPEDTLIIPIPKFQLDQIDDITLGNISGLEAIEYDSENSYIIIPYGLDIDDKKIWEMYSLIATSNSEEVLKMDSLKIFKGREYFNYCSYIFTNLEMDFYHVVSFRTTDVTKEIREVEEFKNRNIDKIIEHNIGNSNFKIIKNITKIDFDRVEDKFRINNLEFALETEFYSFGRSNILDSAIFQFIDLTVDNISNKISINTNNPKNLVSNFEYIYDMEGHDTKGQYSSLAHHKLLNIMPNSTLLIELERR